jgi:quercetin dioxygenase-like cupin family protein
MHPNPQGNVRSAQIVLPCDELEETLAFFTDRLGFRVDSIHPADEPSVAVVSGHGVCIRLQRGASGAPGVLRLLCRDPSVLAGGAADLVAPNGTRVELVPSEPPLVLPLLRPSFVLAKAADARWVEGRAGMRYRDLIPDRQGGRFVASHIRIHDGGPVPDYVHFHVVAFQMIYCARGWVRLVYEDQGAPFVLREGDCVLQPPRIRHRVLESSPGLEVIELGSPAAHETFADHELGLPTQVARPERLFDGQRFVRHQAAAATWRPGPDAAFEWRDLGLAAGTAGRAGARIRRVPAGAPPDERTHEAELLFRFVLRGAATLACEGRDAEHVGEGDAFVVPAGVRHAVAAGPQGLELLEVTLPAGG